MGNKSDRLRVLVQFNLRNGKDLNNDMEVKDLSIVKLN